MTLSEKALEFATKVHAGQFRNDGITPYIEHCKAVRDLAVNLGKRIINLQTPDNPYLGDLATELDNISAISYLHDTVEDQGVTRDQLRDIGMNNNIIKVVYIVSRRKEEGESYLDFILRILESEDGYALIVKWADLTHNLSDLKSGSLRDKYMLARYMIERTLVDWTGGDQEEINFSN